MNCFLVNHGYTILSIRSTQRSAEREAAGDRPNDRRYLAQILVISLAAKSTSVNLHTF